MMSKSCSIVLSYNTEWSVLVWYWCFTRYVQYWRLCNTKKYQDISMQYQRKFDEILTNFTAIISYYNIINKIKAYSHHHPEVFWAWHQNIDWFSPLLYPQPDLRGTIHGTEHPSYSVSFGAWQGWAWLPFSKNHGMLSILPKPKYEMFNCSAWPRLG